MNPATPARPTRPSKELPQQVDTDNQEHQNMLEKFGIEPQQLISRFTGGGLGL